MTTICSRVKAFLDEKGAAYEVLHHRTDYTAQETAADTRTPGQEFAKTVVIRADERFFCFVLPAHHRVEFDKVRALLGAKDLRLATEREMGELFPDCDVGAEPPLANIYGLPVIASEALSRDEHLTFNGGTHEDAVRMRYRDFVELSEAKVADFSRPRP